MACKSEKRVIHIIDTPLSGLPLLLIIPLIMARPIVEIPILKGGDAVRFEKLRTEVENLSSEQHAENTWKLNESGAKAKEYISVRI